ncbi:GNAT family N-acetyltransferase [Longirhabdus pacifica]|uniref:GNAT family N-acetyltransferase n=1 Tax=Longirhabdus pacifica TaxID=2305227 RepID=UPI0013E8EDA0|nr:GNAT family N-acetyltransferase [Longirhabdus pacifica]
MDKDIVSNVILQEANMEDQVVLENLFQLYLHDLSEYAESLILGEDGKFKNDVVELFLTREDLISLKILYKNEMIGFIFLVKGKNVDYAINDMFICRQFRNKGIGKILVEKVFTQYKGTYVIVELWNNKSAIAFWHSIYKQLHIKYEEVQELSDGELCLVQTFTVK